MVQVCLRLETGLLALVDAARGDVPRNRWLVRAVEAGLLAAGWEEELAAAGEPQPVVAPVGLPAGVVRGSEIPQPAEKPLTPMQEVMRGVATHPQFQRRSGA